MPGIKQSWRFLGALSVALAAWLATDGLAHAQQKSLRPPVNPNPPKKGTSTFAKDASGLDGNPKLTTNGATNPIPSLSGAGRISQVVPGQGVVTLQGNDPNGINRVQPFPYPVPYAVPYPQPYPVYPGQPYVPFPYQYQAPMPYYGPYQQNPYPQYPQYPVYPQAQPYNPLNNTFAPNQYPNPAYPPGANPYGAFDPLYNAWLGYRQTPFGPADNGMGGQFGMGMGFRGMWN